MTSKKNWSVADIPDQTGRVAIVTGANTGIGLETTIQLAIKGARVILACRSLERGSQALESIRRKFPDALVELGSLDLSNLTSVRGFAAGVLQRETRLDLLINNAGLTHVPYERTRDGFELQFATNYLGHFLLTSLLIDRLKQTPGSRVVSLSSMAERFCTIDFDNLGAEKGYQTIGVYNQSKLACLMFAYELQRRLAGLNSDTLSLAAHPGFSATEFNRNARLWRIMCWFITQSAESGALPTLRAATDHSLQGGDYIGPGGWLKLKGSGVKGPPVVELSSEGSRDEEVAAKLWEVSESMVGQAFFQATRPSPGMQKVCIE